MARQNNNKNSETASDELPKDRAYRPDAHELTDELADVTELGNGLADAIIKDKKTPNPSSQRGSQKVDFLNEISKLGTSNVLPVDKLRRILETAKKAVESGVEPREIAITVKAALEYIINPAKSLEEELDVLVKSGQRLPAHLFINRTIQGERAPDFCKRVYGRFLDCGCLYKDQLRTLDPYLVQILYRDPGDLVLPTKSQRLDAALEGLDPLELARYVQASKRRLAA